MSRRPSVAFGPVMPGWGSWDWVGADLVQELESYCHTQSFTYDQVPDAEVIVMIKHPPSQEWFVNAHKHAALVYCPIDYYDSAAAIDADAFWLSRLKHVVIHCHRLRRYFASYSSVTFLDHHVKFIPPDLVTPNPAGPILWVGVHTNLPPLVEWVNCHDLDIPLLVLTNFPEDQETISEVFGFRQGLPVTVERWTPERHGEHVQRARAALDIKGDDFRSRHKPPTKAMDFLAAGLPLAMNPTSSSAEHLMEMGFALSDPCDHDYWFSDDYAKECRRFGATVRELLSRQRIGLRWWHFLKRLLPN